MVVVKEILIRTIRITKTITKMKEIINTFKEVYREDKKTFWSEIIGSLVIFGFIIFVYWFVGTFCYDM
jgi:hypothetical protein